MARSPDAVPGSDTKSPRLQELSLWLHWPPLLILLSGLPRLFGPLLFAHVVTHSHQQVYLQRPYGHLLLLPAPKHAATPDWPEH